MSSIFYNYFDFLMMYDDVSRETFSSFALNNHITNVSRETSIALNRNQPIPNTKQSSLSTVNTINLPIYISQMILNRPL